MKKYNRREHHKVWILFISILIFLYIVIANNITAITDIIPLSFGNTAHNVAKADNGWNLILVNRDNYIPDDYEVELTELSNGEKVDSRIYPELQEMFNGARAEGLELFVAAGYRTNEKQQQLLDEKIEAYVNEGHSKSESKKLAKQWVAVPGTSEHQLGIAVDINADTTKNSSDKVYNWLAANSIRGSIGIHKHETSDDINHTDAKIKLKKYRKQGISED